ncbi:Lysophospholipase L1 [Micromonospora rhizosphaerae]|uniref:Lysophospholipase L1 n=1 Tax=Micromonospora rhizosphaerae TaxID=568872 RepID=A0A1C6T0X9_9ACTN|nr:SGNH/GDSL hydrolase family protein [Micromonospora rhizosphaerae]SCL35183.1 Lysophospholipase L1 [Micromonospora rhizosphaerae]
MNEPTILFAGDSVTDCGRREDPAGLGDGYVLRIAEALGGRAHLLNRGISGDRSRDLRERWDRDVLAARPALVSVLVGVNDTWRRYDSDDPTPAADFEANYHALLEPLAANRVGLVLVEPFLLPVRAEQIGWRDDLEPKIAIVRSLAREYGAALVPADMALNAVGDAAGLAPDGVHPSQRGHEVLATLWLEHATPQLTAVLRHGGGAPRPQCPGTRMPGEMSTASPRPSRPLAGWTP